MPAGSAIIGRVAVKVIPDTTDFKRDLKTSLERIEKSTFVKLPTKIDMTGAKRELLEGIRDLNKMLNADAYKVNIKTKLTGLQDVENDLDSFKRRVDPIKVNVDVDRRSLMDLDGTLGSITGKLAKGGTLALGIGYLTGATLALSSNLFAIGAGLVGIGGAAFALPGILGGIAVGAGATYAVFKDFNKILPEVKGNLAALQDQMSSTFWEQAEAPIRNLIDTLLPQLSDGLVRTSEALGGYFSGLATAFTQAFDGQVSGMFANLAESIEVARGGTEALAGVVLTLGKTGSEYLPRMAQWFVDITKQFDGFLSSAAADGRLQGWVDNGVRQLGYLWDALAGIADIFSGIATAAQAAGGTPLAGFAAALQRIGDIINTPVFQEALTGVFRAAHEMLRNISDIAGPAVKEFFLAFGGTLESVLPIIGDGIGTALKGIAEALSQIEVRDAVVALFSAIQDVIAELAPVLDDVVRAFAEAAIAILPALADILVIIIPYIPVLADAFIQVVEALTPLLPEIVKLVEESLKLLPPLLDLATMALPLLVAGLEIILPIAQAVIKEFQDILDAVSKVANFLKEEWSRAIEDGKKFWEEFTTDLSRAWEAFRTPFTTDWKQVWQDTRDTLSKKTSEMMTNFTTWMGDKLDAAKAKMGEIKTAFSENWSEIKSDVSTKTGEIKTSLATWWGEKLTDARTKLGEMKTAFVEKWGEIKADVSTKLTEMKTDVSTKMGEVKGDIGTKLAEIKTSFSEAWGEVKRTAEEKLGEMKTAVGTKITEAAAEVGKLRQKATDALGSLGSVLVGAGRQLVQGFIDGIGEMFGAVQRKLSALTDMLPDWKGPADKDRVLLKDAGRLVIGGFINGMESQYSAVRKSLTGLTRDVASTAFASPSMALNPGAVRSMHSMLGEVSNGGTVINKTLNYHAASGSSLDSEEDLFAASSRTRMVGW